MMYHYNEKVTITIKIMTIFYEYFGHQQMLARLARGDRRSWDVGGGEGPCSPCCIIIIIVVIMMMTMMITMIIIYTIIVVGG